MIESTAKLPEGWHVDPDTGAWMRDTIHHMGRRCLNWDYCGIGVYLITLVLNDRSKPIFGEIDRYRPEMILSELGKAIERHFLRIPQFTSEIEVLGVQIMPDHLHGVLRVRRRLAKSLGECIRGFKIGATKIARETIAIGGRSGIDAGERKVRGDGLFADGFVDTILFDENSVVNGLKYINDNPRRFFEKRAHPDLFRVLRDFVWKTRDGKSMHFAAIGNHELLSAPQLLQVQCSRQYFEYARNGDGTLNKEAPPARKTREFEIKADAILAAASHGAVLVCPCISHGEKEIARRAFKDGFRVVTLSNKSFNPLYKPGGKLFDRCAEGNLLMLAPAAWKYVPGEKKITRMDACALNRIAQLLSADGAVEIDYKGACIEGVEEFVSRATEAES